MARSIKSIGPSSFPEVIKDDSVFEPDIGDMSLSEWFYSLDGAFDFWYDKANTTLYNIYHKWMRPPTYPCKSWQEKSESLFYRLRAKYYGPVEPGEFSPTYGMGVYFYRRCKRAEKSEEKSRYYWS